MEPRLVTRSGVWPGRFIDRQSVVNVMPMVGRGVGWINAKRIDGIDQLQHPLDRGPAGQSQQAFTSRRDPGNGRITLTWRYGAQDIDPRQNGSKVIGRPTDEGKDAARCKRQDTTIAVKNLLRHVSAKPNSVFDALFEP